MAVKQKQKQEGQRAWMFNGQQIRPVLYNGRAVGEGKYFAASVNGELLLDENGTPHQFRKIGTLEAV